MKTAKAPEGTTGSSRRAQPVRQARINGPRTSSLNRANPFASAPAQEQPIDIFPGVTHFADAITALPKELVRHFTLLKEVDAKIFAPEATLFQLLDDALNIPAPNSTRWLNDAASSSASVSGPVSAQNSTAGATHPPPPPSNDGSATVAVFDPANIPRRTLFRDTALKIQEMLVSLEEKNHVISTANDALQKQLSRIEEIWPHLESEFSDEAKWGSTTHWAYVENRQAKTNDKQAERSRREGAATLSAAAQHLAEEAAARSSDRKQAMAAKKNAKNQAADPDPDKAQEPGKKAQGVGKARKPLPDSAAPVGLGISPAPAGSASGLSKRRKVETTKPNGGAPTERAMGGVFGNSASKARTTSPRETPAPESGNKKRKALPTSSNQAKKSRTNATMSPSITSSPVMGTFADPLKAARASPAPTTAPPRPSSSRARQNSTHSNVENARQRAPSAAANKPNGNSQGMPDPGQLNNGTKPNADAKTQEAAAPVLSKSNPVNPESEEPPPELEPGQNGNKRENATAKTSEERDPPKKDSTSLSIQPAPSTTAKTKSGRASKPSTPALATFAEAAAAATTTTTTTTTASSRSRPSRSTETALSVNASSSGTTATSAAGTAKRSHKKGAASISASAAASALAQAQAQAAAQQAAAAAAAAVAVEKEKEKEKDGSTGGGGKQQQQQQQDARTRGDKQEDDQHDHDRDNDVDEEVDDDDDDDEPDVDEPVYCYCNQVSYGEMVACDGEGCPREWFHLECVGLKVAPKGNAKWYCEDCKRKVKVAERR
ncbi:hypothetical protein VTK56DRAFT_9836 [Thermocarpiscus australiensis]